MFFFFQAEDGIRDIGVTGVQTCALPISRGVLDTAAAVRRAGLTQPETLRDDSPSRVRARKEARSRLLFAARCLTAGGVFLAAAAVFHLFAAPHISSILRRAVNADTFPFLEPIVSFTFLLNAR